MRSRATHELDEVPVLAGRVTVTLDVTDDFSINLGSGIEAEGGLDLLVLQVAVDGLGATDDLDRRTDALVVFGQDCSVGVGVVTTDDDERTDIELLEDFEALVKLLLLLELGTTRTDDVEATRVAILVDDVGRQLDIVVLDETIRTHEEAIEATISVDLLHAVEDTCDDVVPARSLTTREDDTDVDGLASYCFGSCFEGQLRQTVGIGEEGGDSFLVANALSSLAKDSLDIPLESLGELRSVLATRLLECTFIHIVYLIL